MSKSGPKGLTYEQVEQAILDSRGILAEAARKLQVSRQTIAYYVKNYASCRKAKEEAVEQLVDDLENKLYSLAKAGNFSALKYALTVLGKERGWQVPNQIVGSSDDPIRILIEYADTDLDIAEAAHRAGRSDNGR